MTIWSPCCARNETNMISDRISLLELAARENPRGVVVEIGTCGGHFTEQILVTWPTCSRLITVDCWAPYASVPAFTADVQEQRFQNTTAKFAEQSNVEIVRQYSHVAAEAVPDASVDFVYIDGDHDRAAVLLDLQSWFPKLKRGAIMAGHDYYGDLKLAVEQFCAENGLDVLATTAEYSRPGAVYGPGWEGPSFWFRKP